MEKTSCYSITVKKFNVFCRHTDWLRQTQELYNLTAVCAMKTEDYAKALECFQAGIALAESKTGDDKTKADTVLLQEMEYNVIVCYEQQADWENAKSAMKQYQADFPEDDSVSKEAEFLQTR